MIEGALEEVRAAESSDWDPKDENRFWLCHHQTGEKGWLVKRNGQIHVRLNRPSCDSTRPYRAPEWAPDRARRPFTAMQIAEAAFEADKVVCRHLGERRLSVRKWSKLTDRQKTAWIREGPKKPEIRAKLYAEIRGLLESVVQVI